MEQFQMDVIKHFSFLKHYVNFQICRQNNGIRRRTLWLNGVTQKLKREEANFQTQSGCSIIILKKKTFFEKENIFNVRYFSNPGFSPLNKLIIWRYVISITKKFPHIIIVQKGDHKNNHHSTFTLIHLVKEVLPKGSVIRGLLPGWD